MSNSPVTTTIYCSGNFPFLPIYDDVSLTKGPPRFQLTGPSGSSFCRVVPLSTSSSDPHSSLVAISGLSDPFAVICCDMERHCVVSQRFDHHSGVWGLVGISGSSMESNPRIVSGGQGDRHLNAIDAVKGTKLASLIGPRGDYCRSSVSRLLHVPEWGNSEIYAGGGVSSVSRYNVERGFHLLGEWQGTRAVLHRSNVYGLSADVRRNLVFAASQDKFVRVWSRNGVLHHTCALTTAASSSYFVADKNILLVGLWHGYVDAWDVRQLDRKIRSFRVAKLDSVFDIDRVDTPGEAAVPRFVSASRDSSLTLWNIRGKRIRRRLMPAGVYGVCVVRSEEKGLLLIEEESERLRFLVSMLVPESVGWRTIDGVAVARLEGGVFVVMTHGLCLSNQ